MRALLIGVTLAFSLSTAAAVWQYGYIGYFQQLLATPVGWLVMADLTIALSLVLVWVWQDSRARGRAFWPYAVVTLLLGSIGPLAYLLLQRAPGGGRRTGPLPLRA